MVLNLVRGSGTNLTSLAGFGQAFEETSFMAGVLIGIDLTMFVWLFVLAVGLAVLYRRRTQSIFLVAARSTLLIVGAVAGVMTAFGGS